ncbi:ribonuclease HII [Ornithobacterium rhinotracheale]|uniref:ribonuclease HII n=1 Tax=Ornithobacterium rhinotracheale TaxID=28251 RepID=UPI004036859D
MQRFYQTEKLEVGCDEAGRGCLAGPVVAGAVILPPDFENLVLNDSKQLSKKKRNQLREIIEREALAWAVAFVSPQEIDEINILNASILAMHRAIDKLSLKPEFIAVDGNKFKNYQELPHQCCIKGDANYMSIAAASILAKTHRDEYMEKLAQLFPEFNWDKNMGYPTKAHRAAIEEFGATLHHRLSFKLLPQQLKLDL